MERVLLFLCAVIALSGCGVNLTPEAIQSAAQNTPTRSATATPSPTNTAQPPALTPQVGVSGPAVSGGIPSVFIDVQSGAWKKTITPNGTAMLPVGGGTINVVVRQMRIPGNRPQQAVEVKVTQPWRVEMRDAPNPNTYAFDVKSNLMPGNVNVEVAGINNEPINFTIQLSEMPTVTADDNGRTITLQVGERFSLNLGEGYQWKLQIDNQDVVSRVANITPVRGSQGVFEGNKPGNATLTATGDLPCRQAQPPCMAPSRMVVVHFVVLVGGTKSGAVPQMNSMPASPTGQTITITSGDNNKTITVHVGDLIVVKLAENRRWNIQVADTLIVNAVTGTQDIFQAKQKGQTTLNALGSINCETPPCTGIVTPFKVNIVVE